MTIVLGKCFNSHFLKYISQQSLINFQFSPAALRHSPPDSRSGKLYREPIQGARSISILFDEEFWTPRPNPLRPPPDRMNMLVSSIGRLATLRQKRSHLLS